MERSVTGEELSAVRAERDRFQALAEERLDAIRDLRGRLDASEEERRRVQAQLTGLLTTTRPDQTTGLPWPRRVLRWLAKQHSV